MRDFFPIQQLYPTTFLGTSVAAVYTSPFATGMNGITIITGIIIANATGSAATVFLHNVPGGGAAGNGNLIIPGSSVPANTSWWQNSENGLLVVPGGGTLWTKSGTGSAITLTLMGREIP